ncbi:hypothetical protein Tco_1005353 [Tanacetum coccineum]|uniref:Uncharacterized protein n=1 Tax=Tanacetum coccineum TaxID=301880 RepID=A0ABQ5FES2_9ASTR
MLKSGEQVMGCMLNGKSNRKVLGYKPKVSTDKEEVSTDRPDEGTVDQNEGRSATQTAPTTTTPTILAEKMIEEEDKSDTDSEDITEAEKKFKQLARDEEVARKVQVLGKRKEVKKLAEEDATKAALFNEYVFLSGKTLITDKSHAKKLRGRVRNVYLFSRDPNSHDTIAAQKDFLRKQISEAIRK